MPTAGVPTSYLTWYGRRVPSAHHFAKHAAVTLPVVTRRPQTALPPALAIAILGAGLAVAGPAVAADGNEAPSIAGKPRSYALHDELYVFTPRATDADGDNLTFSIVNKPKWMWFDTRTGSLKGRPKPVQSGRTFSNIVIGVSDGRSSRSLPAFAINVGWSGEYSGTTAPEIDGSPPLRTTVGTPYYFRPVAHDADGDMLSFSIRNKPAWAMHSTTSGALWGTPPPDAAGTYSDVTISVSDGKSVTALSPFNLTVAPAGATTHTVTLRWSAPQQNTDGTTLVDLVGYRIFYGTDPARLARMLSVPGASIQSAELQDLASGTWYFAIRSVNKAGVTSELSTAVSAALN